MTGKGDDEVMSSMAGMTSLTPESEQEGFVKTANQNYVSRKSVIHGTRNVEMKGKSIIHPHCQIRGDFANIRIGRYCHIGSHTILRPPSYQTSLGKTSTATVKKQLPTLIRKTEKDGDPTTSTTSTSSTRTSNADDEKPTLSTISTKSSLTTITPELKFLPLLIGNHTLIGSNCVIESASIGSNVRIGSYCVISKRVIIKDCCFIEDYTILPPDTVIPPFSRVSSGVGGITFHTDESGKGSEEKRGAPGLIMNDPLPESVAVTFVDDSLEQFAKFVGEINNDENV